MIYWWHDCKPKNLCCFYHNLYEFVMQCLTCTNLLCNVWVVIITPFYQVLILLSIFSIFMFIVCRARNMSRIILLKVFSLLVPVCLYMIKLEGWKFITLNCNMNLLSILRNIGRSLNNCVSVSLFDAFSSLKDYHARFFNTNRILNMYSKPWLQILMLIDK